MEEIRWVKKTGLYKKISRVEAKRRGIATVLIRWFVTDKGDPNRPKARCRLVRRVLRDRPHSVKFMLIVTDPPNVSTREIINISREFTEITALSYGARALLELVPRPGWLKLMKSDPTKPLVLPTPRRENKTLVVETDENGKEVDVENAHDDVRLKKIITTRFPVIDENESNETSNIKLYEVDTNKCDEIRSHFGSRAISVQVNIVAVSVHVFHIFPFDLLSQVSASCFQFFFSL